MCSKDLVITLFRDSLSRPWGFRLVEDVHKKCYFVQRVSSGSPSEGKLLKGDRIISVNDTGLSTLSYRDVVDLIRVSSHQLALEVHRSEHQLNHLERLEKRTWTDNDGSAYSTLPRVKRPPPPPGNTFSTSRTFDLTTSGASWKPLKTAVSNVASMFGQWLTAAPKKSNLRHSASCLVLNCNPGGGSDATTPSWSQRRPLLSTTQWEEVAPQKTWTAPQKTWTAPSEPGKLYRSVSCLYLNNDSSTADPRHVQHDNLGLVDVRIAAPNSAAAARWTNHRPSVGTQARQPSHYQVHQAVCVHPDSLHVDSNHQPHDVPVRIRQLATTHRSQSRVEESNSISGYLKPIPPPQFTTTFAHNNRNSWREPVQTNVLRHFVNGPSRTSGNNAAEPPVCRMHTLQAQRAPVNMGAGDSLQQNSRSTTRTKGSIVKSCLSKFEMTVAADPTPAPVMRNSARQNMAADARFNSLGRNFRLPVIQITPSPKAAEPRPTTKDRSTYLSQPYVGPLEDGTTQF